MLTLLVWRIKWTHNAHKSIPWITGWFPFELNKYFHSFGPQTKHDDDNNNNRQTNNQQPATDNRPTKIIIIINELNCWTDDGVFRSLRISRIRSFWGSHRRFFEFWRLQSPDSQWSRPCGDHIFQLPQIWDVLRIILLLCVNSLFLFMTFEHGHDVMSHASCMTTQPYRPSTHLTCLNNSVHSFLYIFAKFQEIVFVQIQFIAVHNVSSVSQQIPNYSLWNLIINNAHVRSVTDIIC